MKKFVILLISVLLVTMVSGCTGIPDVTTSLSGTKVFKNLDDDFAPLKEFVVMNIADDIFESSQNYYEAEAVLAGTSTSKISFTFDDNVAFVTIDGKTVEVPCINLLSVEVVDLDQRDDLHEIAIFSEGPSADPCVCIIRYDGNTPRPVEYYNSEYDYTGYEIYGFLDAGAEDVQPTYGAIWCNGKGKVITPFDNMGFTDRRVAFRILELDGNKWKETFLDGKTEVLGEYKVAEDFKAFFTPCNEKPADISDVKYFCNFDFESMKSFSKDEKIEILDCKEVYGFYSFYIEYKGERGVLTFWLGD